MKKFYSVVICVIMCIFFVFCAVACNTSKLSVDTGKTDKDNPVEPPAETYIRSIEQDTSDLQQVGYNVEVFDGMVFGMFEPIADVEKMLLVDLSTEDTEHFICIMYFPSEEILQENLSEYTRFKEYLIGPMPNYANEHTVLTSIDRCFIVATNNGLELLPIVEHKGDHDTSLEVGT